MKVNKHIKAFALKPFFLLILLFSTRSPAQTKKQVTFINPDSFARQDELIVLKRPELEKHLGALSAGYVRLTAGGKEQVVQYDDLNSDGKWDEAVLLCTFRPKEKLTFAIAESATKGSSLSVQRAHVRLRKKKPDDSWGSNVLTEEMPLKNPATDFSKQALPPYLAEGPGWENDRVGFRLYFDVRNGKDIWGKRTSRLVLDSVGTKAEPSYHELHDWGMDILHAGKSLSAGALALLVPMADNKDSLIRLGGENIRRTVYHQLADGPLRAVFQITYDWEINGKPVQVKEQTAIWGGQYFYESKLWVTGAPEGTKLVSGIASFYENVFQAYQENNVSILFSYGQQAENKDNLGLAILVPSKNFSFAAKAPDSNSDILNSYLAAQKIKSHEPCVFRFISAWGKSDGRFANLNSFKSFLGEETGKMGKPIIMRW